MQTVLTAPEHCSMQYTTQAPLPSCRPPFRSTVAVNHLKHRESEQLITLLMMDIKRKNWIPNCRGHHPVIFVLSFSEDTIQSVRETKMVSRLLQPCTVASTWPQTCVGKRTSDSAINHLHFNLIFITSKQFKTSNVLSCKRIRVGHATKRLEGLSALSSLQKLLLDIFQSPCPHRFVEI